MADTYANYAALAAAQRIGIDYQILSRVPSGSRLAHIAIHAGDIEPGTGEIADVLSSTDTAADHLYYAFDGMRPTGNNVLFLGGPRFDEPIARALVARSDYTVSWHGSAGSDAITYVSGLDTVLAQKITDSLRTAGFTVVTAGSPAEADGADPANITNLNAQGKGVQVELTLAQRQAFFTGGDLTRANRGPATRTPVFTTYVAAVQAALAGLDEPKHARDVSAVALAVNRRGPAAGQLPGDFGVAALSPLFIDGMPLEAVSEAIRLARRGTGGGTTAGERFWSSPPRPNGDPLREVYEVSLSTARRVNRLAFSLAHFPQRVWLQYRDQGGVWRPLTQPGGAPAQLTIADSEPQVIPAGVPSTLRLHPQHFGAQHWMAQEVDVSPVVADRFRLIMARIPSSGAPRSTDGSPVAYSLGVKDVSLSYRLASPSDMPWLPMTDASHTTPIAQGQDLLGSAIDYVVRRSRAASVLGDGGVWRCAPQPVPNAVVNLYLDVRSADGKPQVIDRIECDPLTSGPTVNLYYAPVDSVKDWGVFRFAPISEPLGFPQVRAVNDGVQASKEGLYLPGSADAVRIDGAALQFDTTKPFLVAGIVQPQFTSVSGTLHTILDTGGLAVCVSSGAVSATLGQLTVSLDPIDFGFNARVPWAVAFDGENLTVRTPWSTRIQPIGSSGPTSSGPVVMLGGPVSGGPGGMLRITSLFLAQGRAQDIGAIDAYWGDPTGYGMTPGGAVDASTHTCANALLRFDGSLVTPGDDSVCPLGLIGGPGVDYSTTVWTPINGDFQLQKQAFTFRPVKASFLKLEFTNLQPMLVNPTGSPVVRVQLFPGDTGGGIATTARASDQASTASPPGLGPARSIGVAFQDSPQRTATSPYDGQPYLPTEALFAVDPQDAQRLRSSGTAKPWRFMPLPGTQAPRWLATGVHRYRVVELTMDAKTAYTVAVKSVRAFRTSPAAQQDTEQYVELLHDTSHLDGFTDGKPDSWVFTEGGLVTPDLVGTAGVRVTSVPYVSRRKVLGIQIATTQSDALQLLDDPEFSDPTLRHWRPVGDATLTTSDVYESSLSRTVQVTRGHAGSSWDAMESRFRSWAAIEDANPDPNRPQWNELEQSQVESTSGGIESVRGVQPPSHGRLFAAARVVFTKPLATPVSLQLVNGDGRILAEADAPADSQVAEWYVDYSMHDTVTTGIRTWDVITGMASTWDQAEALGSWDTVAQDFDVERVRDVRARIVQDGASGTGEWLVDSLALFADPLLWEVSRDGGANWFPVLDIRNDPRGALVFPDLPVNDLTGGTQLRWRVTSYAPSTSVSAVVIRPWYASLAGAIPYQDTLQAAGAASALADYYPPVHQDPYFQAWHEPIPQWWWAASRLWRDRIWPTVTPPDAAVLPHTVVEGTSETAPPSVDAFSLAEALVQPIS